MAKDLSHRYWADPIKHVKSRPEYQSLDSEKRRLVAPLVWITAYLEASGTLSETDKAMLARYKKIALEQGIEGERLRKR